MSITQRVRRFLGVGMAGAMVLALMPAGAAVAQVAQPEQPEECENAPVNDFEDREQINAVFREYVDCMAAYGITRGFPDNTYRPGIDVNRQQMAIFIARFVMQAEEGTIDVPTDSPDADFSDSDEMTAEGRQAVNFLVSRDVVEGYTDGSYGPGDDVRRDQMASYIRRALEAIGVVVPPVTQDHFEDDDGTFHEDNINAIAELGIVQGFNDGTYRPGENVSRQQMSQYIMLAAGVAEDQGQWNGQFIPEPPEANQDFAVAPAEAATNTVSTAAGDNSNRGLRQYSVSGLDDGETYDIALFDASDVTVEDGFVTFADDDENNQADWSSNTGAANGAIIEVVNGASNGGNDSHAEAGPVNGTISFSIDSETPDSVVPVIFVDEGTAGADQLAVDDDGAPTEAFGIGGQKTWLPAEAPSGTLLADQPIESVDKDADTIVTSTALYNYDTNDLYFITNDSDDVADPDEQVTYAEFEAQLSAGDSLSEGTVYQRNPDFQSSFLLDDNAPGTTAVSVDSVDEESVVLTITPPSDFDADDTITLSRAGDTTQAGALTCAAADYGTAAEIATLTAADDEDDTTSGIQYTDTVPAPGCYEYSATSDVDGEESASAGTAETPEPSSTDTTAPDMTSATANDINNGVGSTNQVIVSFSEAVVSVNTAEITVSPSTQPGFVINVTNATQSNTSGTSWVLTLDETLDDASIDITYNITTDEDAYEDAAGNGNVAQPVDTTFEY